MMLARSVFALGVMAMAVVVAPASASPNPLAGPSRIYFYGDSLLVEAANYIYPALNATTTTVRVNAISGTALCDYVYPQYQDAPERYAPGGIMQLRPSDAPRVAVLQFSGNAFTPCVLGDAGSRAKIVANYSTMLHAAIAHLLAIRTQYVIVGRGPIGLTSQITHDPLPSELSTGYRAVIASFGNSHVVYDNVADTSVLNNGNFAHYLPCLAAETSNGECAGLVVGGQRNLNIVRAPDGRHFCPTSAANARGQLSSICPVWDSGAMRFAAAFTSQVWRDVPSSVPSGPEPYVTSVAPRHGPLVGGTVVTVHGFGFSAATSVQIVKYFNPVISGAAIYGSAPTRIFVSASHLIVLSSNELTFVAPALDQSTPIDPAGEFVVVHTATSQSVAGLSAQAFSEG